MKVATVISCTLMFLSGCGSKTDCQIAKLVSSGNLDDLATAVQSQKKKQIFCEGKSIFSVAAESYRGYDSAEILLSAGVSPNLSDESGGNPLHVAAMWADLRMVRLLIENGVDSAAKNNDGATPLDLAKIRTDPDGVEIVKYLSELKSRAEHSR